MGAKVLYAQMDQMDHHYMYNCGALSPLQPSGRFHFCSEVLLLPVHTVHTPGNSFSFVMNTLKSRPSDAFDTKLDPSSFDHQTTKGEREAAAAAERLRPPPHRLVVHRWRVRQVVRHPRGRFVSVAPAPLYFFVCGVASAKGIGRAQGNAAGGLSCVTHAARQ
eukprot:2179545-Pyramimonas_sp.AAC.1